MMTKLHALQKIYREETKFDWLVLGANVLALAVVTIAFLEARQPDRVAEPAIQIADAGL